MATLTKRQKTLVGKVDTTKLYTLDSAIALGAHPGRTRALGILLATLRVVIHENAF